tara:strand:- start:1276 stop:1716 length:441 start_codon:yes stop_codon:yes gene_type:complete
MASFNYGSERASLDEQYDLLGCFADSHAVFSRLYESRSDAARASIAGAGLSVDAGHGVVFDLFPAPSPAALLFVLFHGGLWRGRGRGDMAMVASGLVPSGFALAVVDGCLIRDNGPPSPSNARAMPHVGLWTTLRNSTPMPAAWFL